MAAVAVPKPKTGATKVPSLTYNVNKITAKGAKVPRSIVLMRDSVALISEGETRWSKKPGQIIGLSSDDPEGKTFTLTTVHQQQFQSDDPSVQQKLREALGKINAGVPSIESVISVLDLQPASLLKPPAGGSAVSDPKAKKASALRGRAADIEGDQGTSLLVIKLEPSQFPVIENFELLHVVGKGSFGKVFQVKHKASQRIYALKILKKIDLHQKRQIEHTLTERKILATINHPFMPRLHYAFQTDTKLYMVIDYANGGEIFFHLRRAGRFPEVLATFYVAEVVSAIHHLHKKDIIYRDLKPENVLLDTEGHVKLTDFGLSKIGITSVGGESEGQATMTFCGTPEYLAPEILQNMPHGKAVDWWSVGILMYEMLTGIPPFYSTNKQEMFLNTLRQPLNIPENIGEDARDFIKRSLVRRPEERLGSGPGEGQEVKDHPIFKAINWDLLEKRQVQPPFKPKFKDGIMDISNIDKVFLNEALVDSAVPPLPANIADSVNKQFMGFEYNQDIQNPSLANSISQQAVQPSSARSNPQLSSSQNNPSSAREVPSGALPLTASMTGGGPKRPMRQPQSSIGIPAPVNPGSGQ